MNFLPSQLEDSCCETGDLSYDGKPEGLKLTMGRHGQTMGKCPRVRKGDEMAGKRRNIGNLSNFSFSPLLGNVSPCLAVGNFWFWPTT